LFWLAEGRVVGFVVSFVGFVQEDRSELGKLVGYANIITE